MARALCELQLELQCQSSSSSVAKTSSTNSKNPEVESKHFMPKTPAGKESKRKLGVQKVSANLTNRFTETEAVAILKIDCIQTINCKNLSPNFLSSDIGDDLRENCNSCRTSKEVYRVDSCLPFENQICIKSLGNFPTPRELASVDENILAKRCKLGYRASRILKLAQSVVEGRIQLEELEEVCKVASLASYDMLADKLREINGFGPFTCANVLVCMGFYHIIPTDSETTRHLEQVHARESNMKTVQRDVEEIYGKYAPFQFLAYWSELWHFYETRFGKLSEMPQSDYKLITASNMRTQGTSKNKKAKVSL